MKEINFSPVWMKSLEENFLVFYIKNDKRILKSLKKSKNIYKTASVITHRSPKSNPNENKGILLIGKISNWEEDHSLELPQISNPSILKQDNKFFLVKMEIIKVSYWSGIRFGSHSFKNPSKDIFKGFEKRKFIPSIQNGKNPTLENFKIINSSQYLIIAVITKQGIIHATPVDFTVIKNRVLFATSFFSAKFKGFKFSNIASGFTYQTTEGFANYSKSLTFHGVPFAYGWNFFTSLLYGFLFAPYLAFVSISMFRKYPQTMRNFPFKQTNIRWQFMPFVARTFIEIHWQEN
ncbi:MAG: hypothetical protein ACW981_02860 [Candidatus Hodarchaeales archaeon]